jgi:hypothetical protein
MDKKLIQQFGEDIFSYRIRTKRQKIRARYEDFDKFLLQLDREESELYRRKRNLGWIPLTSPIQRGWKRFFVLREDVARSRHAEFFNGILEKINTCVHSNRKDFKVRKKITHGKWYRVVKMQKLLEPEAARFNKLGLTEKEKLWFIAEYRYDKRQRRFGTFYVFKEPWRFVLKIKPNMVDRIREHDEVLEAQIHRMREFLDRNNYRNRQLKLKHGYVPWRHFKDADYRESNPLKNRSLQDVLDEASD